MTKKLFWEMIDYIVYNNKLNYKCIEEYIFNLILEINENTEFDFNVEDVNLENIDDLYIYQKIWLIPLILNIIYKIKSDFVKINREIELKKVKSIDFQTINNENVKIIGIHKIKEYESESNINESESESNDNESESESNDYESELNSDDSKSQSNSDDSESESNNHDYDSELNNDDSESNYYYSESKSNNDDSESESESESNNDEFEFYKIEKEFITKEDIFNKKVKKFNKNNEEFNKKEEEFNKKKELFYNKVKREKFKKNEELINKEQEKEEFNKEIEKFNKNVDKSNKKIEKYNKKEDIFNKKLEKFNKKEEKEEFNKKEEKEEFNKKEEKEEFNKKEEIFNNKIKEYNSKIENFNEKEEEFNRLVKIFNKRIEKFNKKIQKFNKKIEDFNRRYKKKEEYNKKEEKFKKKVENDDNGDNYSNESDSISSDESEMDWINRIVKSYILFTNMSNLNEISQNKKKIYTIGYIEQIGNNYENNEVDVKIILKSKNFYINSDSKFYFFELISYHSVLRSISSIVYLKKIMFYDDILYPPIYKKFKCKNIVKKRIKLRKELKLNKYQMEAFVKLVKSKNNFELIQGPPGTGKTKLVISLIYYLLTRSKKNKLPKILVCSTSNNIVDTILKKFLKFFKRKKTKHNITNNIEILRLMGNFKIKKKIKKYTLKYLKKKLGLKDEKIIKDRNLFFSTINYTGSYQGHILKNSIDYWIVDEACQSIEPEILIPFTLNPKKIFLFGDPLQLCPFSFLRFHEYFNRSLFERFMDSEYKIILLKKQYRMLPDLSEFPNNHFYDNKIINFKLENKYPLLQNKNYLFIDYKNIYKQKLFNKSYYNIKEIEIIIDLIIELKKIYPDMKYSIITPYRQQVLEMQDFEYFENFEDIKTIDSFQGKENDIIIISLVRTNGYFGILSDLKRLNVLMTRAKYGLYFIGKRNFLKKNKFWLKLLNHLDNKEKIITYDLHKNNLLGLPKN